MIFSQRPLLGIFVLAFAARLAWVLPIIIVYLPFLLAALVYVSWPRWQHAVRPCLVVVLAFLLTVMPWAIRNRTVYGQMVLVSSGLGTKLWPGNNEMTAQEKTTARVSEAPTHA